MLTAFSPIGVCCAVAGAPHESQVLHSSCCVGVPQRPWLWAGRVSLAGTAAQPTDRCWPLLPGQCAAGHVP